MENISGTPIVSCVGTLGFNGIEHLQREVIIEKKSFHFNHSIMAGLLHFLGGKHNIEQKKHLSAETFMKFLIMLEEKHDLNSLENMLELWDAVYVLQIPLLVQHYERVLGCSINDHTLEVIYTRACLYGSSFILTKALNYMLECFESVYTEGVTRIITYEDLMFLVEHDELCIEKEDTVLLANFQWAENRDMQNERCFLEEMDVSFSETGKTRLEVSCEEEKQFKPSGSKLSKLLRASRFGLASLKCLEELSNHHLCEIDPEAKHVLSEGIAFKLARKSHGYWPSYATHRSENTVRHLGALANGDKVSVLILSKNIWKKLPRCPLLSRINNLTVFNDQLYAVCSSGTESLIFCYKNSEWKFIADIPGTDFIVVSYGEFIYFIDIDNESIKCLKPEGFPVFHGEIKMPSTMHNPESAADLEENVLVFCSTETDEMSEVYSLQVPDIEWTRSGTLQGSAKYLVSFRNKNGQYILQRDGSLSQVLRSQDKGTAFTLLERLWSFDIILRGAFIFQDILYIAGNSPSKTLSVCGIPGVCWNVEFWHQVNHCSSFVHFFLPRSRKNVVQANNENEDE
ncbi:kelch-like protein 8 [Biomphalaria pfeifferi]|uniref:Kelch-like protein 8 n=1 Tax=Biomphalaria pfeifferi TaxID=112525 RepID=A0AAD8APA8_BIOPF|nr:kelch-like protein 8 [Biomphalaria pfeifferi]